MPNGDGFSEIGKTRSVSTGAESYWDLFPGGTLGVKFHMLREYRRGGDAFDKPEHERGDPPRVRTPRATVERSSGSHVLSDSFKPGGWIRDRLHGARSPTTVGAAMCRSRTCPKTSGIGRKRSSTRIGMRWTRSKRRWARTVGRRIPCTQAISSCIQPSRLLGDGGIDGCAVLA